MARLRVDRFLTGAALGRLVGMSQAKISKLERGVIRPAPGDIEMIPTGAWTPTWTTPGP